MNLDDIKKVLELVREHDLAEFELEQDGLKVRVRKSGGAVTLVAPAAPMPMAQGIPVVVGPATAGSLFSLLR